jgi:hypothetical protein
MSNALELRLNDLEAKLDIRDLKARYWRAVDRQDLRTIRDCLLSDAKIDMEGVGIMSGAEFIDFVERNGCKPGLYNLHAGQNPIIAIESANQASGVWDVFFTSIDMETRQTIRMSGDYADSYLKVDGRWKIAAMTYRQFSFLMHAYDENGKPSAISMGKGNENAFGV